MSLFSENQTKNFYVVKSNDVVKVSNLAGTDKFRVIITDNAGKGVATTDILSEKLILNKKMNVVLPEYYRKWTVAPVKFAELPTEAEGTKTFSLYFYLENLLGFGLQDRWDIVAIYKATYGVDSVATIMTGLKNDLIEKIGAVGAKHQDGPIANDFVVTMDEEQSASTYCTITISENPASKTYHYGYIDMLTHDVPYEYDLTLSTYDGNAIWGNNKKVIYATNTTTVRIAADMKVMDMEHYFSRNRADLYDLNPNFGASIINELRTEAGHTYALYDVHYAFSDGIGLTYFSEKDMTIAVDLNNTAAMVELNKVLKVANSNMDSVAYIGDEASWAANYWRLADYFASDNENIGNKTEWNGDGWIVWNFPAGKYAGKKIQETVTVSGTEHETVNTVTATGTTSYLIMSVTTKNDWDSTHGEPGMLDTTAIKTIGTKVTAA